MQKYEALLPMYVRGAQLVFVAFDLTSTNSFEKAKQILQDFDKNYKHAVIVLVGNKVDLQNQRKVSIEEVEVSAMLRCNAVCQLTQPQNLKRKHRGAIMQYFETSAKQNTNISEMFDYIMHQLIHAHLRSTQSAHVTVTGRNTVPRIDTHINNKCLLQ